MLVIFHGLRSEQETRVCVGWRELKRKVLGVWGRVGETLGGLGGIEGLIIHGNGLNERLTKRLGREGCVSVVVSCSFKVNSGAALTLQG